jgi:CDGSH iron-sulfur domain-containing protein 3
MDENNPNTKTPVALHLKAGDYYWCSCGNSANQPFCDGTHKVKAPEKGPLKFTMEEEKEVWLCRCKATKNAPFCDGTHKTL